MTDSMQVPILYNSGKIIFSSQFVNSSAFMATVPLLERSRQKADDIGAYLFFVHGFQSIYKSMPEDDRFRTMLMDGRVIDPPWLEAVLEKDEVQDLIDYYCTVALSPAQRLYQGLTGNMQRLLEELSNAKGSDDIDHTKLVDRGIALHEKFKEVEKMILTEGDRRVRSDYKPRRYENRPIARATRQV